jgi:hypothetical protein
MRQMYMFDPPAGSSRFRPNPVLGALGGALLLGVLFIGIFPGPVFHAADDAAEPLFERGADLPLQAGP